jgi:hypothetical protein
MIDDVIENSGRELRDVRGIVWCSRHSVNLVKAAEPGGSPDRRELQIQDWQLWVGQAQ